MDYSIDASTFAIGGDDKIIKIFDENMKIISHKFSPGGGSNLGHDSRINSISYNKDPNNKNMMVSGGWDRNMFIYDIRQSKEKLLIKFLYFQIKGFFLINLK